MTAEEIELALKAAQDRFIARRSEIDAEMKKLDAAFCQAVSDWREALNEIERHLPELLRHVAPAGSC